MRIVLLGPAYPFRGGIATHNERLAQELLRRGHVVEIFTFTVQYPSFLFPGKSQYREGPPPEGVRIRRIVHSLEPFSWWRTGKALAKFTPEAVLVKFWLPVMGVSLGSALRVFHHYHPFVKRIAILHNFLPHESRLGDRVFTRFFVGSVDGAVAMSAAVAQDWQACTPKPLRLLFHPLYDHYGAVLPKEEACAALGLDPAYRYLLFFGLIRPYKGLDLLLQAWASEKLQTFSNVRLLIAGELYESYEAYQPLLAHPANVGRVIFHEGFVPEEKVKLYFSAADAVILPYRNATQSGITQIALHFEKPMIATRVGGLPEVIQEGQTGLLCEPTPESLCEAIAQFLTSDSGYFSLYLQAAKAQYSWGAFAGALEDFIRSLSHAS
ncbi:MAG: glycosyltransferase [Bacteroidia bacterium]|nr:glycosyltransferase [Bacteroidia bacterium]